MKFAVSICILIVSSVWTCEDFLVTIPFPWNRYTDTGFPYMGATIKKPGWFIVGDESILKYRSLINDYHRPFTALQKPLFNQQKIRLKFEILILPWCFLMFLLWCVCVCIIYLLYGFMVSIRFVRLPCSTFGSQKSFGARKGCSEGWHAAVQGWTGGWQQFAYLLNAGTYAP